MIYPVPQKNNLSGKPVNATSLSIEGKYSDTAEKAFLYHGIGVSGGLKVEIDTSFQWEQEEKYTLSVSDEKVIIGATSRKGVFRACHTIARLIKSKELCEGTLEDYPLFKVRGYIEGFYGHTWEEGKRLSVMGLMASYGMNTFYYAPKDDLYHREKWRESYPENELSQLKELFLTAKENMLDFYWAIGPGLTYKYTSDEDFNILIEKIKSIYDIGVRNFGLLLDDIPNEFQYPEDGEKYNNIAEAHVELVNKTYKALKDFDSSIRLTVCPTQYSGDENGDYIVTFGKGIPEDVSLFWTGAEICSRVLTVREAKELEKATNHKPLYWDNYPVNDCEMYHEMHLDGIQGRDRDLYNSCEGIISNVMEYAECSKIPLMTIADFLWNPVAYNKENSLKNAHREMLGEDAELFGYFADHLGVSCLSKYSSAFMSTTLARVAFLEARGEKEKALEHLAEYNYNMRRCLSLISDTSVPLFDELKKWVRKFSMCCDVLDAIYTAKKEQTEESKKSLAEIIEKYNFDAVILTGFCLREMAEKTLAN